MACSYKISQSGFPLLGFISSRSAKLATTNFKTNQVIKCGFESMKNFFVLSCGFHANENFSSQIFKQQKILSYTF